MLQYHYMLHPTSFRWREGNKPKENQTDDRNVVRYFLPYIFEYLNSSMSARIREEITSP